MKYLNKRNKETNKNVTHIKRGIAVIGSILAICSVGALILSNVGNNRIESEPLTQEQTELSLADTTPLKDTIFWDTFRDYPKYRMEAAEKLEELVANGMELEEACRLVIDEVITKVYEEKSEFIRQNNELGDGLEEAYQVYLKNTQY